MFNEYEVLLGRPHDGIATITIFATFTKYPQDLIGLQIDSPVFDIKVIELQYEDMMFWKGELVHKLKGTAYVIRKEAKDTGG